MEPIKRPTPGNGKICYIEIPANDVMISASFYKKVFGWQVRERSDGQIAFDDGIREVSGTWVIGRNPSIEPGLLIYIMVENVSSMLKSIVSHGGKVVQPIGGDDPEITARFSDPYGNVLGLYQEPTES
jgi:uncharacterized protein